MRQTSGTMHAVSPIGHEGFVVVKELTSPSRLDALRKAALRRMALPFDESCVRPHNTLVPLRWNDESVRISLSAPGLIDRIRTALSATDLRWISGYLSVKEPSSGPLWWHQDWWAWDHPATFEPGCPQAAVLIYLTATSTDNGALRIIPGSHHRSHPLHAHLPEPHSAEISGTQDTLPAMQDAADQVTVAAGEGDAVVMDYRLLHGTHPNDSDDRRIAVMLNFVPSWNELSDDIKGHLIQHPALPGTHERDHLRSGQRSILPDYEGRRADLPINRKPPVRFAIGPPQVRSARRG